MVILVSIFIVSSQWVLGHHLLFLLIALSIIDFSSESLLMKWPKYDSLCMTILALGDIFGEIQSRASLFVIFAVHGNV